MAINKQQGIQHFQMVNAPVEITFTGGVNPKGAYNAGTAYILGDSVSYLGSSYVAIGSTTGNLPTDTTKWQVLANKGDTGLIGETGAKGDTGAGSAIRTFTWTISNPTTGGIPGPRLKEPHTVTRIDSYIIGTSSGSPATAPTVSFNIEERSTIATPGVNIMTSEQVSDANGESITTFANDSLATDSWLWIDISATTAVPTQLVITLSALT